MKTFAKCCLVAAIFFCAALALMTVDRSCAFTYDAGGMISAAVEVFVEKLSDLL